PGGPACPHERGPARPRTTAAAAGRRRLPRAPSGDHVPPRRAREDRGRTGLRPPQHRGRGPAPPPRAPPTTEGEGRGGHGLPRGGRGVPPDPGRGRGHAHAPAPPRPARRLRPARSPRRADSPEPHACPDPGARPPRRPPRGRRGRGPRPGPRCAHPQHRAPALTYPAPMSDEPCPCGTDRPLSECCGPLLTTERLAETAEELMRSRYTAHVFG